MSISICLFVGNTSACIVINRGVLYADMGEGKPIPSLEDIAPEIRLAEECDLPAINALYAAEYGKGYPGYLKEEDLRGTDRFVRVVLVAIVDGEIGGVAQTTTFRKKNAGDTDWSADNAFELKGLVVRFKDRHRHIGQRLLERRLEALIELGARIAYVEPICRGKECASARNVMNHKFSITGILPAKYPDELVVGQPESVAMGFRKFKGELGWGSRGVYLPADYLGILNTVLPQAKKLAGIKLLPGPMPSVRHIPAEVAEGRSGSAFAEVPANWPEALPRILELREQQGYLLAGVMPDIFTTATGEPYDTVVMYKPPIGVTMNFDAIHVVPGLQPLHDFMQKEYQKEYTEQYGQNGEKSR